MKRTIAVALLFTAACSPTAGEVPEGSAQTAKLDFAENAMKVPGFADFLVIDGETVWTTNDKRIEQWSSEGKLATVEMPKPCGTMAMAEGSLWVGNCDGGEVYRIDPKTAQVLAKIPAGVGPSGEQNVVAGAGAIWVPNQAGSKVSRIDPATNAVVASIDVDAGTTFLTFGFDAVWAASGEGQSLQRIDPASNTVTGKITMGKMPGFLVAGEGAVWVQEQGDGTVARVDPAAFEVTGRVKVGDNLKWGDIDTGDGKVWLRTTDDQTFVVIDVATLDILARVGAAEGSGALRYTADGVWTSAHDVQTLTIWTLPEE